MEKVIDGVCRAIEAVIALALAVMVILVFGNVVLRYGFNSGITVSEELSRWIFVWLIFLGAIVALKEGAHLGSDMLVSRLNLTGKRVCAFLGHLLMLYITWLFLDGSWTQVQINKDVTAPVTGASVAIFYSAGVVFSLVSGLLLIRGLWRIVTGRVSEDELVMVKESEEEGELEELQQRLARENLASGAVPMEKKS
jgi:TRAP-type C4-dicarboxylate transport system permease small subunit